MRTLAIGDIHGCRRSFEALADYVSISPDDTLVTLGDYVDRGPDSKGVIDRLIALADHCKLIPLLGNHEIMMRRACGDLATLTPWLGHGGRETLASYGGDSFDTVPESHWAFILACRSHHEDDTHFFVHANADADTPLADQPDFTRYWEPFGTPAPHQSGKIMVCGHTSQKSGLPKDVGHAICIDTNACRGGWLTCLDTGSGTYWQTNEAGDRRMDKIACRLED